MKHISQYVLLLIAMFAGFTACEKADKLPLYGEGSAPQLTASTAVVTPPPADSNKVVLTLNWTDPGHAQDKSLYKYYLEIDSAGRNFSKATIVNVTEDKDKRTFAFLAKGLNDIALSYGFEFNKSYDMDFRVVSSYGNNNDQKKSNIVKVKVTPYKIPPKVTLPSTNKLYIVGNATLGDWSNPIPSEFEIAQEFSKIDETTYGGIFQLNGGNEYLILPEIDGSWGRKYAIPDEVQNPSNEAGRFTLYDPAGSSGKNFPAPGQSGLYKITLDFQRGNYKVEPFTQQHGLPSDLWVVGNAFTDIPEWKNENPMPNGTQFTRVNSTQWSINVNMKGSGEYLILPFAKGNWDKYAIEDKNAVGANTGGKFKPQANDNFPSPTTSGNYKISVNLFDNSYQVIRN